MLNKSERTNAAGWLLSAQTAHEQAEVNTKQDPTTSEANPPSETSTTADKSSSRQDIILGPSEISLIATLEATISIAISDESIPDAAVMSSRQIEFGVDGVGRAEVFVEVLAL
ncbi:uncharacterized protein CCOS01_16427 [Colletotrichum costaricense]|uniref:Uncharacterized protein n=1 Tax=Colletotrichum costaricense TaxID=1209916 RepID=A0AAJ0DSD0_9PEZI|nr:uncharacterized protein CCOS01_16427 [Colletotrichum costaricense]KAK1506568.1 hypothetical protein CCOS01_16427 [Colletotrichum costaricense]